MASTQLRLFVDPSWHRENLSPSPLLYPFWGNPPATKKPLFKQIFERHTFDTSLYSITESIEEADMVFLPYDHNTTLRNAPELLPLCEAAAMEAGKRLLIDGMGDLEQLVTIPDAIVLRYGGYRSSLHSNEIVMPLYTDDLLEAYCDGKLLIREKNSKPVIGFAGWAVMGSVQELKTVLKELPTRLHSILYPEYRAWKKGIFFRRAALHMLQNSNRVITNFKTRDSYSGNTETAEADPKLLQKEMVELLLASDYGLDVRGDANASMRLFEILSLGRIPVIIDTERNLPFSDVLNYNDFCLVVDYNDLRRLPDILAEFHDRLSPEAFMTMQQKAREAYIQYFRVDAIMPHLIRELQKRGVSFKS